MKFEQFVDSEDAIFHYTKKKVFFENILPNLKLRLSPLEMMNDPMEYREPIFTYHMFGYFKTDKKLKNKAKNLLNNLKQKQSKIACFCSNNNSQTKGYLRSRMWSQYGENHEGICLVFSKQALNNLIDKTYKFEAVEYIEELFPLSNFDFNYHELKQTPLDMFCDKYFENKYKKLFFTKIIDYRDEVEFRLLKRVKDKNIIYDYIPIEKCLKGIIVGDRFHSVYNIILKKLEKENSFDIRKCEFDNMSGLLSLITLDNSE